MRSAMQFGIRKSLLLVLLVFAFLAPPPHFTARAAVCTKWCLDCQEYQGTSFCAQCISSSYVTDYNTHQCNVRPSYIPCRVANCEICTLNGPNYCYMCADGYQQKDKDLQCYLLPTTTTTSTRPPPTTTTTTTTTTPVRTTTTTTPKPTTTTTSTTTTSTTTTTTTTAVCNVLWCTRCNYNDGNVCAQCYSGFTFKKSNKCEPTNSCYVDGCAACNSMDSSVCLSCRAGYTFISPSTCQNNAMTSAAAGPLVLWANTATLLAAALPLLASL